MAIIDSIDRVVSYVSKVVTCAYDLYNRISLLRINEQQRKQLLDNLDTLQQMLHYIRDQQDEIACSPKVLDDSLAKVQRSLQTCLNTCEGISQKSELVKLWTVYTDNQAVSQLNLQLLSAIPILQNCLGITSFEHHKETRKHLQRVEGIARNPYAGIYAQKGTALKAPGKVNKPVVECEGGRMHVQWTDKSNPEGSGLRCYEVQYDEGAGHSTQVPPDSTGCTFDQQVLRPGRSYSIRVRGVNGRGPGEWSESTVCRFKGCPPEQPQSPSVRIDSPTDATVLVALQEQHSNGEPVTNIVVEYCDENSTAWCKKRFTADVTKSINEVNLHDLAPDTNYQFRVKLQNCNGTSPPSAATMKKTEVPVPGNLYWLRVSSKRTAKMIKIRWKEPHLNPHSVHHYEIECKRKGALIQTNTSSKASVKFKNLESNTKYSFRVRAVNKESRSSDWSDEITGETRIKGGQTAAAVAAGVGAGVAGTIGAPAIGTFVGTAVLDTAVSGDLVNPIARVAGGIGGGILATVLAPVTGIATGVSVYVGAKLIMEATSPQSSDDEDLRFPFRGFGPVGGCRSDILKSNNTYSYD